VLPWTTELAVAEMRDAGVALTHSA
jgi:hypothetical protein